MNRKIELPNMKTLSILILIIFLLIPWVLRKAEKRIKVINWLSPIVICYLIGMLLGNLSLDLNTNLLQTTSEISVCLAIPLLLFSSNFVKWSKYLKSGFFSFILGVFSVVLSSALVFYVLKNQIAEPWKIAGMMIGVYTGGTPNMSAIGIALNVDEEVFILLNSADIVFSGIYFIFLISIAKSIYHLFLPRFNKNNDIKPISVQNDTQNRTQKEITFSVITSIILATFIFGVSVVISLILTGKMSAQIIILGITSLGIIASFSKRVQQLAYTYQSAEYLLMVFALSMGAMADFSELLAASSVLFLYCGFVVLGAVLIQLVLAFIFKIDADTLIISSTAAIFGPAFIGPVSSAIKNEKLIASGIIMGLLGYAIGNYLGLAIAWILK